MWKVRLTCPFSTLPASRFQSPLTCTASGAATLNSAFRSAIANVGGGGCAGANGGGGKLGGGKRLLPTSDTRREATPPGSSAEKTSVATAVRTGNGSPLTRTGRSISTLAMQLTPRLSRPLTALRNW